MQKVLRKILPHIIFVCCILFSASERPFRVPDEARYVEIPKEMVLSGDFVTPRLNSLKYFEKPPLFYWMETVPFRLFGPNELAMRGWGLVLSFLSLFLLFRFVKRFYNSETAYKSCLIFGSCLSFVIFSQMIVLDTILSFFTSVCMMLFFEAIHENRGIKKRILIYIAAISCALAVLTKGIIALIIIGGSILLWCLLTKSWGKLRGIYMPTSLLIFLAISVPWHVLASFRNPEFFDKYIITEHITRFLTDYHDRTAPFWFFIPVFIIGLLPWSFFIPKIAKHIKFDSFSIFLITWTVWPIIFFSLSQSKLIGYIVPVFLPASVVIALSIRNDIIKIYKFTLPFMCFILIGWPYIKSSSAKDIIKYAMLIKQQDEEILSFGSYYQDIPVYTGLSKVYVSHDIGELEFGADVENPPPFWIIRGKDFERIWTGNQKFLAISKKKVLKYQKTLINIQKYEIIHLDGEFILFRNR